MALPLMAAVARRNFSTLPEPARSGGKRCRSEKAQAVAKRALEKCGDVFCGETGSSVRIPLLRRFILSCNPPAKQQRPESDRSRKNEQTKYHAAAVGLGIDAFYSDRHEGESKHNSQKRIKIERVNEQDGDSLIHWCHRSGQLYPSLVRRDLPRAAVPDQPRLLAAPTSTDRLQASPCGSPVYPSFPAKLDLPLARRPCFRALRCGPELRVRT